MMSSISTADCQTQPNIIVTKPSSTPQQQSESNVCACSNISIMQLFHELKAQFPAVPDQIVQQCINKYYHDRNACISLLNAEQARLPRGLPYPPGLMGVQQRSIVQIEQRTTTDTNLSTACTTCGMLGTQKLPRQSNKHDATCTNYQKVIVETKDNLHKVTPPTKHPYAASSTDTWIEHNLKHSDVVVPNKTTGGDKTIKNSKMKNAKLHVQDKTNNSAVLNNNDKNVKNENLIVKHERSSGNKLMKKINNKVGKFAEKISRKSNVFSSRSSTPTNDDYLVPEIRTHSPSVILDRFSAHDIKVNLVCGSVGFSKRKDLPQPDSGFMDDSSLLNVTDSPVHKTDRLKSQSMECLLSTPTTSEITEKPVSLQNLNRLEDPLSPSSSSERLKDNDKPISESTPKISFSLSKSTRLKDFKESKSKPPLPSKPSDRLIPPKKPERKKSPIFSHHHKPTVDIPCPPPQVPPTTNIETKTVETNETDSPQKNLETPQSSIPITNQKPPLPKRPTTLLDPSTPRKPLLQQLIDLPGQNSVSPFNSPTSVNVSLNVNVDVLPSLQNQQKTVLNVNPELGWLTGNQSPRSITSVNLTLRTPTSEPQPPIDIQSSNSGLTYSSSSFDPRKGFQSSVQITVGPAGGTVSSVRMRPRSSYIPESQQSPIQLIPRTAGSLPELDSISHLIKKQLERKELLRKELMAEKKKLAEMQLQVKELEIRPYAATNINEEELRLRGEINRLQFECKNLAAEVDRRSSSKAPLGETNEEFYKNIYTGQRVRLRHPTIQEQLEGGPPWTCQMCTFRNHPLLNHCEQCQMIRPLRRGNDYVVDELLQNKLAATTPANNNFLFISNNNNEQHSTSSQA